MSVGMQVYVPGTDQVGTVMKVIGVRCEVAYIDRDDVPRSQVVHHSRLRAWSPKIMWWLTF